MHLHRPTGQATDAPSAPPPPPSGAPAAAGWAPPVPAPDSHLHVGSQTVGEQHGFQQTVVHQTVLHQTVVAPSGALAQPTLEPRSERLPGFIPAPEAADIDLVLPPPGGRSTSGWPASGGSDDPGTPMSAESLAVHRARAQLEAQRRADRRRIRSVRWVAVIVVAVILLVMLIPLIRSVQKMNEEPQGAGRAAPMASAVPLVPGQPPS